MTDYVETFGESLPTKERVEEVKAELEAAGVKYVLSSWIDLFGIPKTKPVPMSDFEQLCMGKGCLLYTSPSPRDATLSRMPSSA